MNIDIRVNENGDHAEVILGGEIDAYTAPKLKESIFPLSEKKNIQLLVDLSNVTYMDSTGLGIFVGMFKNVRANNGSFELVGLSDRLKRLFEITGLADIMEIKSQAKGGTQ